MVVPNKPVRAGKAMWTNSQSSLVMMSLHSFAASLQPIAICKPVMTKGSKSKPTMIQRRK